MQEKEWVGLPCAGSAVIAAAEVAPRSWKPQASTAETQRVDFTNIAIRRAYEKYYTYNNGGPMNNYDVKLCI